MLVTIALVAALVVGLLGGYIGVASVVVIAQAVALLLVLLLIPVMLNLSRSSYGYLLGVYFAFVASAIMQYAHLAQTEQVIRSLRHGVIQ